MVSRFAHRTFFAILTSSLLLLACEKENTIGTSGSCSVSILDAAAGSKVGDEVEINGVTYIIADEVMLREMVKNKMDVTKVITSLVTDMSELFAENNYHTFNQDISCWDVSNVTNMSKMFYRAAEFNQDISGWDISNVEDMSFMFFNAYSFNKDISNWNVKNVSNMSSMFNVALGFNQDISSWDVSNVTDMSSMFSCYASGLSGCRNPDVKFNQDLSSWSVSKVIGCQDFAHMNTNWTLPKPNFTNCDPN